MLASNSFHMCITYCKRKYSFIIHIVKGVFRKISGIREIGLLICTSENKEQNVLIIMVCKFSSLNSGYYRNRRFEQLVYIDRFSLLIFTNNNQLSENPGLMKNIISCQ
ncbi:hypothetical protein KsCSTR_33380 [Candidatus Kuenenia stuttgartiensis]|uniref:Uncharacterized protein n=1 Tax=Kuenenia stuttgartiensis TaxID=174633 RepID=Q1Q4F6_KUEST|nr:hypothetical protein KsCSTR_33380 [Candidatus Kuenenia stuttgartiensis]CAJ74897.1 unknown protein [Candidatus Kuenenia stuttgartiensis]SOH02967.1 hypothetical protein KSMBR1_0453 [Candidatus Kuenenia stuttgartiensis]